MSLYSFQDLTLEVEEGAEAWGEARASMAEVLQELSWARAPGPKRTPSLRVSVRLGGHGSKVPPMAREVFRTEGFSGLEHGDDFYLTDHTSLFRVRPRTGEGQV